MLLAAAAGGRDPKLGRATVSILGCQIQVTRRVVAKVKKPVPIGIGTEVHPGHERHAAQRTDDSREQTDVLLRTGRKRQLTTAKRAAIMRIGRASCRERV